MSLVTQEYLDINPDRILYIRKLQPISNDDHWLETVKYDKIIINLHIDWKI